MDIFGILTGISPWWWVAAALALGIVEVLTFSFFLIWPGLAALVVAIAMWLVPDLSGTMQILIFAILSVIFTLLGRQFVLNRKPTSETPGLNQRSAQLVGRNAVVIDGFASGGLGNVEVDGMRWRARMSAGATRPASGQTLEVVDTDGMTLVLSPPT
jgi:membrane protein implicated in regulation of membrane protease activity